MLIDLNIAAVNGPMTVISIASGVAAFLAMYYTTYASQKPEIFAGSSKLKKFLDRHVKTLKTKFYPAPYLIEGRLQTIFGIANRSTSPSKIPYTRELFPLSDGGEIGLDYMMLNNNNNGPSPGPEKESEKPFLVLFLPGLTSSSQTSYVRTLVQQLNKSGASVVVYNHRGNGGVPFKTPKTYSASYTGDLEEVIPHIKKKFPDHRLIGLGTSLGGMILAKYLVTKPADAKEAFESAILISIAWDCGGGGENLEKGFINKKLINKALTQGLIRLAQRFLKSFENPKLNFDKEKALTATTIKEFDAAVTAPQFGFATVQDYYKSATTNGHIHEFSIPVFAMSAADDPMQPKNLIPTDEAAEKNSKLALVVTSHGGHLGWIEGFTKHSEHYLERFVGELVTAIRLYGQEELEGV